MLRDAVLGPAGSASAGVPGFAPVLGGDDGLKAIKLADVLETVVDKLPGAGAAGVRLRSVRGWSRRRGRLACVWRSASRGRCRRIGQHAIAAAQAFLRPDGLLLENPEELVFSAG